jgi:hypothetical protein
MALVIIDGYGSMAGFLSWHRVSFLYIEAWSRDKIAIGMAGF